MKEKEYKPPTVSRSISIPDQELGNANSVEYSTDDQTSTRIRNSERRTNQGLPAEMKPVDPYRVPERASSEEPKVDVSIDTANDQVRRKTTKMQVDLLQPWSVPVLKTKLPDDVLETMIEISDKVLADPNSEDWGPNLVGQTDKERAIPREMLLDTDVMGFFLEAIRTFVKLCKNQQYASITKEAGFQEEWLAEMLVPWIVSQYPGEYNPLHEHSGCHISAVMYLKIPEMLPSRKAHRPDEDGAIIFQGPNMSSAFCETGFTYKPEPGDFFIFSSQQQHGVYPFRCAEGQQDTERRSVSFNGLFQSKSDFDNNRGLEPTSRGNSAGANLDSNGRV